MSNYVPCDCVFVVIFFKTMFNKTVIWFDFFAILLVSGISWDQYLDLDHSGFKKEQEPHPVIVY